MTLVEEAYTSQTCPGTLPDGTGCLQCYKPKGRVYRCPACGFDSASRWSGLCQPALAALYGGARACQATSGNVSLPKRAGSVAAWTRRIWLGFHPSGRMRPRSCGASAPAECHYVLCGFALQFLPHLDRGLAEFRRVLRPHGHLALSTWGADDARWAWYKELRRAYGATIKLQSQSFEEPAWLEGRLREAGFEGVWVALEPFDWVCVHPEEWWEAQWSMSSRAGLEQLEPQALERFKAEVFHRMRALEQPDGFHELLRAQFTLARKA